MNQNKVQNSTTRHDLNMAGSHHNFNLQLDISLEHLRQSFNTLEGLITHLSQKQSRAYRSLGYVVRDLINGAIEEGKEDNGDRDEG